MSREDDELVVPGDRRSTHNVHDQTNVGFIGERDVARHVPVVVRVRAIHRTGKQHHASFLGQQLGHANSVVVVIAARAMGAVLLDGAEWQHGDIILFSMGDYRLGRHLLPP